MLEMLDYGSIVGRDGNGILENGKLTKAQLGR